MVNLGLIDALNEVRVVVQQHYENRWYGLGWLAIALGMCIGLVFAVYIIYYLIMRCGFPHLYAQRRIRAGKTKGGLTKWLPEVRRPYKPYLRVAAGSFLIVGIIFAFLISMNIAGYNYVTSPVTQLILGGISAYMFSSAIQNFGSGYWNNVEDKFEENNYLRLPQYGADCRGYLKEKHGQFVELHHINERGFMVDVKIANTAMANAVIIREHEWEIPVEQGGKLQLLYKTEKQINYDKNKQMGKADVVLQFGANDPGKMMKAAPAAGLLHGNLRKYK